MLLNKAFFQPQNTTYWSNLRIQLHFLLTEVAAWNGIIPLSKKDLSEELNCTEETVHRLLVQCIHEKVIDLLPDGKIQLLYYIDFHQNVKKNKEHYVRHFSFLRSESFRALSLPVQRFILWAFCHGVYSGSRPIHIKVKRLYHRFKRMGQNKSIVERGIFNINSKQEMLDIIQQATPFLSMSTTLNKQGELILHITGATSLILDTPIVHNKGKELWVQKKLAHHDFITELISHEKIVRLSSLMDVYVQAFGFEKASQLFDETCAVLTYSDKFAHELYNKDAHSVGLSFQRAMEEIEEQYGEQLILQLEKLERFVCIPAVPFSFKKKIEEAIYALHKKVDLVEDHWKKRILNPIDTLADRFLSKSKCSLLRYLPDLRIICATLAKKKSLHLKHLI